MNTDNSTKINQLLSSQPKGIVLLSSWLKEHGYSLDLLKSYRKTNWLESIGIGAMIRKNDSVRYEGAVYALQKQAKKSIHMGGKTALSYLGKSHYLNLSNAKIYLFGHNNEKLPSWFKSYDWGVKWEYHASSFLPKEMGLVEMEFKTFSIKISGAPRALLECLYLVPAKQSLYECYELMEGLNNLRPKTVQELLENCNSIKVNRLFLYLAEKAEHQWFGHLDMNKINLGSGKRSIVKDGVYVSKYKITVPKELESIGKAEL